VGHLDVVGDYQQGASGLLKIDVDGTAEGDFDTVNVTGNVDLGGTLTFDVTNLTAESGTFRFLTAGSSEPPGDMLENTFQNVDTVGNDDIYVALSFGETPQGAGGASLSGGTFDANGEICSVGDMNCSGDIDMADVPLFARALRTPTTYHQYTWNTIVKIIFANDAGNVDGLNNGLDFDDIDDFALVVAGSGSGATVASVLAAIEAALHAVPEPSSSTSWFIGACLVAFTGSANRRRSRR
jgi:hypothetical protein